MDVLQIFQDIFPVRGGLVALELADAVVREDDDQALVLTVRLIVWERVDDALQIRDIKEQEVYVGSLEELAQPRLPECVAGWAQAAQQVFEQDDVSFVETLMPHDLICNFPALLALKRPRTADDFAEAVLTSKQRLGAYLQA